MNRGLPGALLLAALAAAPPARAAPADGPAKVDPGVREVFDAGATQAEFLVWLGEQARLAADGRLTKQEKGRRVYAQLRETARRTQAPVLAALRAQGAECRPFWIANMIWTRGPRAAVETAARRDEVAHVVANPWVHGAPDPAAGPALPRSPLGSEPGVRLVNATGAWALGFTGQGAVVGGADTGYQWNHPALRRAYRGWDGTAPDHNYNWHDAIHSNGGACGFNARAPCDDGIHGTHTMGIMVGDDGAGNQVGVAPGARWIGCRNMNMGWGSPATYAECLEWFVAPTDLDGNGPDPDLAPDVINNSWSCTGAEGCIDPEVLRVATENVRAAGIVVVSSAGNNGPGCGTINNPLGTYAAALTVGSVDRNDRIAGNSSRGPVTADGSQRLKPDLVAPGVEVRSSVPGDGYTTMSGTSMAGPHVAGLVALLLSAHPELRGDVDGIERLLTRTARPLTDAATCSGMAGTNIPNFVYGWGRVDAVAALGLGDADADGMPDWWELWRGLDRGSGADAGLDPDGDGLPNREEYLARTDPHDPDSDGDGLADGAAPFLRGARGAAGFVLCWPAVSGAVYAVEQAAGPLSAAGFDTLQGGLTGAAAAGWLSYTDAAAGAAAAYRLRAQAGAR